jgi:hypothetical protein
MQYCVDHPDEMNKISKIKSQVAEVKGIMMDNIEKVRWIPSSCRDIMLTYYDKLDSSKFFYDVLEEMESYLYNSSGSCVVISLKRLLQYGRDTYVVGTSQLSLFEVVRWTESFDQLF